MRILIYGLNFTPELTGIGKYTGEMAEWLAIQGHEVRVVTAPPYYPQWRVQDGYLGFCYTKDWLACKENSVVDIWRCPLWVPQSPNGIKRLLHLASFSASSGFVALAHATWRPDLVFAVEPTLLAAPWALLVGKLSGAKTWLHIQDFEMDAAFDLGLLRFSRLQKIGFGAEIRLLRGFDRVSTISERMLEKLREKHVSPEKLVCFPNWVDTEKIFPLSESTLLRKEWGVKDDTVIVLYAGNMGEKQGLEIIIETAKKLEDDPNIHFVLCGNGAARERIVRAAHGMKNIRFLPVQPLEKFNQLLNTADIHLLPQRCDTEDLVMPSKLTGIFACGGIVIATARKDTELANVVQAAKGMVCTPGDSSEMSTLIKNLAEKGVSHSEMRITARNYAELNLSKEAILSKFYDELVKTLPRQNV